MVVRRKASMKDKQKKNVAVMIPLALLPPLGSAANTPCPPPARLPFYAIHDFFTECKLPTFCCVLKLSTPFLFAQKEHLLLAALMPSATCNPLFISF